MRKRTVVKPIRYSENEPQTLTGRKRSTSNHDLEDEPGPLTGRKRLKNFHEDEPSSLISRRLRKKCVKTSNQNKKENCEQTDLSREGNSKTVTKKSSKHNSGMSKVKGKSEVKDESEVKDRSKVKDKSQHVEVLENISDTGAKAEKKEQRRSANKSDKTDRIFPCGVCKKRFKAQNHLSVHYGKCHKNYCIECSIEFSTDEELEKHLLEHFILIDKESGRRLYKCDVCGKVCLNSQKRRDHKLTHVNVASLECDICHQKLKTQATLNYHKNTVHRDESEKKFECDYCVKKFWSATDQRIHLRSHTNQRPYLCHICSKAFKTRGNLINHQKLVHNLGQPFLCDVCGSTFKTKRTYLKHCFNTGHLKDAQIKPPKVNEFICTECGKVFPRKHDFQVHFRIHTGVRPFRCTECGKSFRCCNHLKQHMVIHTGEKPFPCKYCGKGFSQLANVNCHMKKCKLKMQRIKTGTPEIVITMMDDGTNRVISNKVSTETKVYNQDLVLSENAGDVPSSKTKSILKDVIITRCAERNSVDHETGLKNVPEIVSLGKDTITGTDSQNEIKKLDIFICIPNVPNAGIENEKDELNSNTQSILKHTVETKERGDEHNYVRHNGGVEEAIIGILADVRKNQSDKSLDESETAMEQQGTINQSTENTAIQKQEVGKRRQQSEITQNTGITEEEKLEEGKRTQQNEITQNTSVTKEEKQEGELDSQQIILIKKCENTGEENHENIDEMPQMMAIQSPVDASKEGETAQSTQEICSVEESLQSPEILMEVNCRTDIQGAESINQEVPKGTQLVHTGTIPDEEDGMTILDFKNLTSENTKRNSCNEDKARTFKSELTDVEKKAVK